MTTKKGKRSAKKPVRRRPHPSSLANPRYKDFSAAFGPRERLLLAKYGPIAATWEPNSNIAFDYVLQVAEDKPLLIGAQSLKTHLFDVLKAALRQGDGKVFRDMAEAVEIIAAANKGTVYHRTAKVLLDSQRPPKDWKGNPVAFNSDMAKTADEVLTAANKKPTQANQRTLRRLQKIFGAELKRKNSVVGKKRR
ncbi:MAG: hypothetical protein M3N48_06250 [Verrucomicrobiota bacterium]|nr:hypothetical protein [Verrucomicrobiota bacterium]